MKTLKAIPYQSGLLFCDESAEIKEGDWVWYHHPKQDLDMASVHKVLNPNYSLHEPAYRVHFDTGFGVIEGCKKIIAQHNLNLEDIPYVELEEDVEKLADEYNYHLKYCRKVEPIAKTFDEGFKCGYKAAQPKKYTEDDLRKVIEMAREGSVGYYAPECPSYYFEHTEEQIIQSLQPKIESIEVETKRDYSYGLEVVYEKLSTYQKDGKTYLKIKKVNYENT